MADVMATKTVLDGLYKVVYEDELENLPYGNFVLQDLFKFRPTKKTGKNFQFPVVPDCEQGYVYGAPDSTMTLPDSQAGSVIMGTVSPYQGLLKSVMNFEAAFSAAGGPESFRNSTQFLFERMMYSHRKRFEIDLWYGQKELARVASIGGAGGKVITITTAEWAPGVFAGMEGARIVILDTTGATQRTNAATTENEFKITAVDLDLRTITVEAPVSGDAPNAVVATDRIFFKNQVVAGPTHRSAHGLHYVVSNAASLWGINPASFSLWKSGSKAISPAANLSLDNIFESTAIGAARGLDGETTLLMNVQTWRKLLTNQAALRQYDVSYTPNALKNGAMELAFFAQTGRIVLKGSVYCKEGYAFLVQPDKWFRIGPTEITFKLPGLQDQMFDLDPVYVAYRVQTYHSQALVTPNPGHAVVISGILNS